MKNLFLLITLAVTTTAINAIAQVVPSPSPLSPVTNGAPAQWLIDLILKYPKLIAVLAFIGGLRLILKPTFSYLHTVFQGMGLTSWDNKETAVEQSQPVKVIFFLLDYLGSIKLPVASTDVIDMTKQAMPSEPSQGV